jgi:hypothetical protein
MNYEQIGKAVASVCICIAVGVGLVLTKESNCLWGLLIIPVLYKAI